MPYKDYNDRLRRTREYKAEHPEQTKLNNRIYNQRHRKERVKVAVECERRHRLILSDSYVRRVLGRFSTVKRKDFPQQLVEAKREYLKLRRMLHEYDKAGK